MVGKASPERVAQFKALSIQRDAFDIDAVLADADAYYARFGNLRFQEIADRLNRAGIGMPGTSTRPVRSAGAMKAELSHAERWQQSFEELAAFQDEHGHIKIPFVQTDGRRPALYSWLHGQMALASKGQLDDDRRARLEALGVKFKNADDKTLRVVTD
jgi:hypothetical protein